MDGPQTVYLSLPPIVCLPSCHFPLVPLSLPLFPFKISLVQGPPTPCFTLKGLAPLVLHIY